MIAGKLFDTPRMDAIGQTLLSDIDLLPLKAHALPPEYHSALSELAQGDKPYTIVKQDGYLHTLKMLTDIEGQSISMLRVSNKADVSTLGIRTMRITILMLLVAALVLTLTLWFVLKGMLLLPIEHLTTVLRGEERTEHQDGGDELMSTVRRLTDSRGLISQRNDEIGELLSAFDDLSLSLQEATASVWRIAHLDGLTGLANRRLMMERLNATMADTQNAQRVAILFIDLDDFKLVNDQLGHEAGDQLLVEVAARITAVVGKRDVDMPLEEESSEYMVARIGGDEFVVSLTAEDLVGSANDIAAGIVDAVSAPYVIDGNHCVIGACVGLAVYPEDADHLNGILAYADAAMYEAKRSGKNTWRRFVPELSRIAQRKSA